jgi:hypothetical protein
MSEQRAPGQTPTQFAEGLLNDLAGADAGADRAGYDWYFASGALLALGVTGQLDEEALLGYDERMRAEASRIWGDRTRA